MTQIKWHRNDKTHKLTDKQATKWHLRLPNNTKLKKNLYAVLRHLYQGFPIGGTHPRGKYQGFMGNWDHRLADSNLLEYYNSDHCLAGLGVFKTCSLLPCLSVKEF